MYDFTEIIIALMGLLSAIITAFLVPYIKNKTSAEKLETATLWVDIAVEAAEQVLGSGTGKEKKKMVKDFLKSKNVTYNEEEVDAMIESAVRNLKANGGEVK